MGSHILIRTEPLQNSYATADIYHIKLNIFVCRLNIKQVPIDILVFILLQKKMKYLKQLNICFKMSTKCIHMVTRRYKYINSYAVCKINSLKSSYSCQQFNRKYCYDNFKDDSDSDNEDFVNKRDIKNIILPNNDDILTVQINECESLQDIFDLLQHTNHQFNWKNISMAIAMVRELQIMYYKVCMYEKNLDTSNIIMDDRFESILTNDDFLNLISLIEKHYEFMDNHCLSYCLLCLYKLGVSPNNTVQQKISQRLSKILLNSPIEEIEPCVLSRFIVTIVNRRDLVGLYIIKDIWPIILKKIS